MYIQKNISLRNYLTFKISPVAKNFLLARSKEDLINAYNFCKNNNLEMHILGGGSNVTFKNEEVEGLVVKNEFSTLEVYSEDEKEIVLKVSSGYLLSKLVRETIEKGYEGLEYYFGLPGTLGGAVVTNAKWPKENKQIGDLVLKAEIYNGELKEVKNEYFQFKYGFSSLQENKDLLLFVYLKFLKGNTDILKEKASEVFEYRKNNQPVGFSAGCIFKNPQGLSAGQLIDQAGLKNLSKGEFYISDKHANFILNRGNGKISDLLSLIEEVKREVKTKFNIELKEEIIIK